MENDVRRVVQIPNKLGKKIENIELRPWEEITGILIGLYTDDFKTSAIISCMHKKNMAITIPKGSLGAAFLQQNLNNLLGQKISILKTFNLFLTRKVTKTTARTKKKGQPELLRQ